METPRFSLDSNKLHFDLKKEAFFFITRVITVLSFTACFIYWFFLSERQFWVYFDLLFTFLAAHALLLILPKIKNFRWVSIACVFYYEIFFVPVLVFFSNQASANIPIWWGAGFTIMLFILEIKDFWWVFLLSLYIQIYTYTRIFVFNSSYFVITDRKRFFIIFIFSFVGICLALLYTLRSLETRYKKAEISVDKSREIERNASMAKSRFLANMSHEIRTPMNSIIGLSELTLKENMDDETRNQVDIIRKSAYDLLEIIDDVLMYSKLNAGKMKLLNVDFKFDDILKQVIDAVSHSINGRDIKVRIKINHDIPKVVNGDDIRIKQIIMRLMFISMSLTENGRLMLDVDCKRSDDNKTCAFVVKVSDTGCGLNDSDLGAIYGAYDTYDSRQNSNLKGIGLKYSICKELLDIMGGTLEVSSIEGVGLTSEVKFELGITNTDPMISVDDGEHKEVLIYVADDRELTSWKLIMEGFKIRPVYVNSYFTFEKAVCNTKFDYVFLNSELYSSVANIIESYYISDNTYVVGYNKDSYGDFDKCRIIRHPVSSLSLVDVLNNRWKLEDYVNKSDVIEYDGHEAKILVVDDNAVNLKVAKGIFKSYNIDVTTAKSGQEALDIQNNTEFHLVLMDMVMPELSGEDTLNRMRSSSNKNMREVPVVALTANVGGNIREEILDKGFQEYLAKPIKTRYLTQILLQLLPPGILKKVKAEEPAEIKNVATETVQKEVKKADDNVLDTKIGLKNIGDSMETYIKILNSYFNEGIANLKKLDEMDIKNDIKLFVTTVHGIKSTSASIGAMKVSEMFKELEFAGKDNQLELISNKLKPDIEAYKKILNDVKDYLSNNGVSVEGIKPKEEKGEGIPIEKAQALKNAIKEMNLEACSSLLEEFDSLDLNMGVKERLAEIRDAFSMFDFHKLNDIVEKL